MNGWRCGRVTVRTLPSSDSSDQLTFLVRVISSVDESAQRDRAAAGVPDRGGRDGVVDQRRCSLSRLAVGDLAGVERAGRRVGPPAGGPVAAPGCFVDGGGNAGARGRSPGGWR